MRWQKLEITVRILIVEDEPKTGEYLRQGLSEAGFVVDLATVESRAKLSQASRPKLSH